MILNILKYFVRMSRELFSTKHLCLKKTPNKTFSKIYFKWLHRCLYIYFGNNAKRTRIKKTSSKARSDKIQFTLATNLNLQTQIILLKIYNQATSYSTRASNVQSQYVFIYKKRMISIHIKWDIYKFQSYRVNFMVSEISCLILKEILFSTAFVTTKQYTVIK